MIKGQHFAINHFLFYVFHFFEVSFLVKACPCLVSKDTLYIFTVTRSVAHQHLNSLV